MLFLSFQLLIQAWDDACVSSSLGGVGYCSMGLFTFRWGGCKLTFFGGVEQLYIKNSLFYTHCKVWFHLHHLRLGLAF